MVFSSFFSDFSSWIQIVWKKTKINWFLNISEFTSLSKWATDIYLNKTNFGKKNAPKKSYHMKTTQISFSFCVEKKAFFLLDTYFLFFTNVSI